MPCWKKPWPSNRCGTTSSVTSSPSTDDKKDTTMLSGVMEHFGLSKSLHMVAYHDSDYHQHVFQDLKAAIHDGGIVAVTGVVGSGTTVLLARMQQHLREEGQIEVCESLVFDVQRVTLHTLKLALYYDLATEKDGDITGKPAMLNLYQLVALKYWRKRWAMRYRFRAHSMENGAFSSGASRSLWINCNHLQIMIN